MNFLVPHQVPANRALAAFMIRVEMSGASFDHYELLHELMAKAGFGKTIVGEDGRTFHLPDAEYYGFTNLSAPELRNEVHAIAWSVRHMSRVLVTEAAHVAWTLELAA